MSDKEKRELEIPRPKWKWVKIKCRGISPLLMDRMTEKTKEELASGVRAPGRVLTDRSDKKLREIAKESLYTDEEGRIVIPARNLWAALIGAGREIVYKTSGKAKFKITTDEGSRLAKLLRFRDFGPIPITVNDKALMANNNDDWKVDDEWNWTKNPTTGNPMPVIRPRLDKWEFQIIFAYNENEIQEKEVKKLWVEAGLSQGLGSPRAEKGFPCGQWEVIEWEPIEI